MGQMSPEITQAINRLAVAAECFRQSGPRRRVVSAPVLMLTAEVLDVVTNQEEFVRFVNEAEGARRAYNDAVVAGDSEEADAVGQSAYVALRNLVDHLVDIS